MVRAVVAGVVGMALALAGCSGGGASSRFGGGEACPILEQLSATGQTVAKADVSDPAVFDTTLKAEVAKYVRAAKSLRSAVPPRLRDDVDRMIAAAQQHRFSDAADARSAIDEYAKSECKST